MTEQPRNDDVTTVLILNEGSLATFFYRAFKRSPTILIPRAQLPFLQPLFERLANWAVATSRANDPAPFWGKYRHLVGSLMHYYDIFGKTEEWHNQYFNYQQSDAIVGEYGMPYRHVTCNYITRYYVFALALGELRKRADASRFVVHNVEPDASGVYGALYGEALGHGAAPARHLPCAAINAVLAVALSLFALLWSLVRTRLSPPAAQPIFFGADYLAETRDTPLYHDMAVGGDVLLVMRNRTFSSRTNAELRPYVEAHMGDGRFSVRQAVSAMAMVFRDSWRLWKAFRHHSPAHYYLLAALPFKRLQYRALFSRWKPKFFYGRDDYNVEHILRRQELNRIGGLALGVNHSIPNVACIQPMWRYICFDIYYVFGKWVHEALYKDSWAADMKVRAVGSFGFKREQYALFKQPKPKDVVFFTDNSAGNPKTQEIVRSLAEALPDRAIILQVRNLSLDTNRAFVENCCRDLANVKYSGAPAYDLFTQAAYAVSDPSAVVVEAIQAGLCTWFMDIMPNHPSCMFRAFPDLVVTSAADIARHIRAIEDGTVPYPRERFAGLVDLTGKVFLDEVLHDVGLAVTP